MAIGIKKAPNSESRARLASSKVSFNSPNFTWTPTQLRPVLNEGFNETAAE